MATKQEIWLKTIKVILSCQTPEQAKIAYRLLRLAIKGMSHNQIHTLHDAYLTMTLRVTGII